MIRNLRYPRPLSKVNLERLPVYYYGNPKVWMNSVIFEEVLLEIDSYFRAQNKKILLLVDNAPSYFNPQLIKMKMVLMKLMMNLDGKIFYFY